MDQHQTPSNPASPPSLAPDPRATLEWFVSLAVICVAIALFANFQSCLKSFSTADKPNAPSESTSGTRSAPLSHEASQSSPDPPEPHLANYAMQRRFFIGYWAYTVVAARWMNDQYMGDYGRPAAHWLVIRVEAENLDQAPRRLPEIRLVDSFGREYVTSSTQVFLNQQLEELAVYNPNINHVGFLLFDVPTERAYSLFLSGDLLGSTDALVPITTQ